MTTATSSFSFGRFRTVLKQDLRRTRSLAMFYSVLTFLSFPLQYILEAVSYLNVISHGEKYLNLFGMLKLYPAQTYFLFFPLVSLFPIVMGCQLMGYIQNKRAVDVYHALPVTRREQLLAHFAAGMLVMMVPLLLEYGLVYAVNGVLLSPVDGISFLLLLEELFHWLVLTLVVFVLTLLASVCVGTLFDSAIFSMALNAVPTAIYLLCALLADTFLYGYEAVLDPASRFSPVGLMIHYQFYTLDKSFRTGEFLEEGLPLLRTLDGWFLFWLVLGLALLALTLRIYERRKSETAESLDTGSPLKVLIKLAGAFLAGTLLGMLTFNMTSSIPMRTLYLALWSLVAFVAIEAVLARGFKTLRQKKVWLQAGGITAVVCAVFVFFSTGGMGYAEYIPEPEKVESVSVGYFNTGRVTLPVIMDGLSEPIRFEAQNDRLTFTGTEAKELVQELHEAVLEEYENRALPGNAIPWDSQGNYLDLEYTLAGGRTVRRHYDYVSYEKLWDILSCKETLIESEPLMKADPEQLQSVRFFDSLGVPRGRLELTDARRADLLRAIQDDLFARSEAVLPGSTQTGFGFLQIRYQNYPHPYRDRDGFVGRVMRSHPKAEKGAEPMLYSSDLVLTDDMIRTRTLLKSWGYEDWLRPETEKLTALWVPRNGYETLWGPYSGMAEAQTYGALLDGAPYAGETEDWLQESGFLITEPEKISRLLEDTVLRMDAVRTQMAEVRTYAADADGNLVALAQLLIPAEELPDWLENSLYD